MGLVAAGGHAEGPKTPNGIDKVKVAIVQYQVQDADKVDVDADRVEKFVRTAAGQGARLVVAPETCFYRYAPWDQNGLTIGALAKECDPYPSDSPRWRKNWAFALSLACASRIPT